MSNRNVKVTQTSFEINWYKKQSESDLWILTPLFSGPASKQNMKMVKFEE